MGESGLKVSIAMTTYNGHEYLAQQLDSILSQSYADFEVVISDDCSTDGTWNILNNYAQKDSRIKIFKNSCNIGFIKNFERAIKLCSGDLIALADQDDIWNTNHLEILIQNLKNFSASVGNAKIMNSTGDLGSDLLSDRDLYFSDGNTEDKLFRILFYGNPFQGASSIYQRDVFNYALPIPIGIEYHDAWFSAVACSLNGLIYTFNPVTNYRIHACNVSGSHKTSLVKQIYLALKRKGWKTDRVIFCNELISRIPDISNNVKNIVLLAKMYHENRIKGKRLKALAIIIKNYKKIYSTKSYKTLFIRCLGILLKG